MTSSYDQALEEALNGRKKKRPGPQPLNVNGRIIQSSGEFAKSFTPDDYAIYRVVQKHRLYGLTGRTGGGKTAVMLCISYHSATGRDLCDLEVEQGRVLYMAGENPDDVKARWIAMADRYGFDVNEIDVHFIEGRFHISEILDRLKTEASDLGGVAGVMVDTSAAFFEEEDENDNAQMGRHTRMLRGLTELPGRPFAIVGFNPTKYATEKESLQPRGGGATVAELDGNLTCSNDEGIATVHWAVKIRGPEFAPLHFELETVTAPELVDSKGRPLWSVVARGVSEAKQEAAAAKAADDQDQIIVLLDTTPGLSLTGIAKALDWFTDKEKQAPNKGRARRAIDKLRHDKIAAMDRRGAWALTPHGKKQAKRLRDAI